jgi:hypothetical protein
VEGRRGQTLAGRRTGRDLHGGRLGGREEIGGTRTVRGGVGHGYERKMVH